MKNSTKTVFLAISLLFSLSLPAQEAIVNNNIKTQYTKIIHSVGFEFNNALYFKGQMVTAHPYPDKGYEPRNGYGTEWILKYNLTFKNRFGFSLEAIKGTRKYFFYNRYMKDMASMLYTPLEYLYDLTSSKNLLGFNLKASYRYDLSAQVSILPEIGVQMLYYEPFISEYITTSIDENGNEFLTQYMLYHNEVTKRKFFPDLSMSVNFLFHKRDNPRHNFTVGLNANFCFVPRYVGGYSVTPPFEVSDAAFVLSSSYVGLRLGYLFSSFSKPIKKPHEYGETLPYVSFDLSKPVHSIGLTFSGGFSLNNNRINGTGIMQPQLNGGFVPELNLKYSCLIKKGWGISIEVPFGTFKRSVSHGLSATYIPSDTVWSNGAVGVGYPNYMELKAYYLGLSLKASNLVQVHKNISLQSEAGLKWLPFVIPAFWEEFNNSVSEFVIGDGNETHELGYMEFLPEISMRSYIVPDLAFSFNVLVHGKNPAHNFVFGINCNISFMDRFHFKYQTTDVLPAHLQSSGEFGWRMSSIGFHVGYQFMKGKKREKM